MKIRTFLVDDEPLGRERIRSLLAHEPDVEIIGEAEDGEAALDAIQRLHPDLVFLDIQMPGLDGFGVVRGLTPPIPLIIFVTAYDQYAIDAFEQGAIDYLLKPVSDERLLATRERILARMQLGRPDSGMLEQLLQRLGNQPAAASSAPPLAWITASNGRDTQLIMLEDVIYFRADSKYTTVVTEQGESLLRTSLRELLDALDPQRFRQIHRSTIVNMKAVAAVTRDDTGRGQLRLKHRTEVLNVSQPFMSLFRGM
jgi:DNA-binding LytR/AlgR family response regulator